MDKAGTDRNYVNFVPDSVKTAVKEQSSRTGIKQCANKKPKSRG